MSDAWEPIWREGVVEGDSACVWGDVDWSFRLGDVRHVARLACSWCWTRVDGRWQALFSHYTIRRLSPVAEDEARR